MGDDFLPASFHRLRALHDLLCAQASIKPDPDNPDQDADEEKDKLIAILFPGYFLLFYVMGQGFSSTVFGFTPLQDKKMGLRQMMFMSGLNSFEYFSGMLMADFLILTIPNVVFTVLMPLFDMIMASD